VLRKLMVLPLRIVIVKSYSLIFATQLISERRSFNGFQNTPLTCLYVGAQMKIVCFGGTANLAASRNASVLFPNLLPLTTQRILVVLEAISFCGSVNGMC